MIVAIFAIGLVIYVIFLTATLEPDDEPSKTLILGYPEVDVRTVDTINYSDITVRLEKVTPNDSVIKWSELRLNIKSANGQMILPDLRANPDDPFSYYNGTNTAYSIEVWYIDSTSSSDRMNVGDSIKVTGLTGTYEFGTIDIIIAGEKSGSFTIPEFLL